MEQPLVSILMPYKNTENYIDECLASILNQMYSNWEAIIVNDHSSDTSEQIVLKYAKKDSRFKAIKNEGKGIIMALRTAFKASNGSYITRMDSDDIMTSNRLEVMVSDLMTHGKNHLSVGMVNYFRVDGLQNGFIKYESWLNELTKTGHNYSEIYKECVVPSPCWMLYRDDFIACGGFDSDRYPEDYDLAFRFYKHGFKCIPCKQVLLHWRDYSTRTSRTHKHYAENYFLDLKIHHFLDIDYQPKRNIVVWGAGNKGKSIAKLLLNRQKSFYWVCDNTNKIGKHIYDVQLRDYKEINTIEKPQIIITVANDLEQQNIKQYLKDLKLKAMEDYFFFC